MSELFQTNQINMDLNDITKFSLGVKGQDQVVLL